MITLHLSNPFKRSVLLQPDKMLPGADRKIRPDMALQGLDMV